MSSFADDDDVLEGDVRRHAPRRGTRIIVASILSLGLLLGLVSAILLWRPALLLGVDSKAVAYSLSGESGSILFRSVDSCDRIKRQQYDCFVVDTGGSSSVKYRVVVDGRGCWRATLTQRGNEGQMPRRPASCISLWDYQRVWDVI